MKTTKYHVVGTDRKKNMPNVEKANPILLADKYMTAHCIGLVQ
jgi:hypothetical protein